MSTGDSLAHLTTEEAKAAAFKDARGEGVFAGLTGGLVSGLVAQRIFKLGRWSVIGSIVVAGVGTGYLFTEALSDVYLTKIREAQLEAINSQPPPVEKS
ncbi:hypothetical protein DL96DRAFT_234607 [Flagelloscypha sp. PMI_526]|nr:hypothetical protein DL96DRAFT_234607 [Flagelloscypha sp. PMI_526]